MDEKETDYMDKYHALFLKQENIKSMIDGVRFICKSLDKWQQTASDIFKDHMNTRPELSGECWKSTMDGLRLHSALVDYHRSLEQLLEAWRGLRADQQKWLPTTDTLKSK